MRWLVKAETPTPYRPEALAMALVLEIEHLSGVCFAAKSTNSDLADWPLQPDRIFSALVASWAARGCDPAERRALLWLETQPPPLIAADEAAPRTAPVAFVPPNDPRSRFSGSRDKMLGAAGRQPRRFPAVAALDRSRGLRTKIVWGDPVPPDAPVTLLDEIARDTSYVGHSASLTRCRFFADDSPGDAIPARRIIYPNRLAELEQDFAASQRPASGAEASKTAPQPQLASSFGSDWLVLEIVESAASERKPDLRAAPLVAKVLRDSLMSGYGQLGVDVPRMISGHEADGAPTRTPHLAVVPLANVGFSYSDATIHGFALVPPRGVKVLDIPGLRDSLGAITTWDPDERFRKLTLRCGRDGEFMLRFGGERASLASLNSSRYLGPATTWATATPMVLGRHLKSTTPQDRQVETAQLIALACEHIGLPAPAALEQGGAAVLAISASKHSAIAAAPSASPSGNNPAWMRWRVSERLASRGLTHTVVRFAEAVQGPIVLGAGRFVGLGLCLPLDDHVRSQ